jgi:hypothetical protein
LEHYDDAIDHLSVLSAAEPRESYAALTAYASARLGEPRPARRFLDEPRRGMRPKHYLRAYAHMGLGERPEAIGELRAAVENNEPWTILLPLDGVFAGLRDERAYRSLPLAVVAR